MQDLRKDLLERFVSYTAFDTMSDPEMVGIKRPTTDIQIVLLEHLRDQLRELGIPAEIGRDMVVAGTLKGNVECPTIGFMAHVDTAHDCEGHGVKAQVWDYEGGDIKLNDSVTLTVEENPDLDLYKGSKVITSDGTTLLGSDDKAGVSEIMSAVKYLVEHPEVKHGDIEIYFTPDEEVGSGLDTFDYGKVKAAACYTIDGAREGEVETECFNAAQVHVKVEGVSIHLGSARGIMVNAVTILSQIVSSLPQAESPEATDGRYGYYCPLEMKGSGTEAELDIFIRDFDMDSFKFRIEAVEKLCEAMNFIYRGKAEIKSTISYYNMAEVNKQTPKATEAVFSAAEKLGIDAYSSIIRGGTDGARMANEHRISCPNVFTGGHNLHSVREWVALEAMNRAANLVLGIADEWTRQ